MSIGVPVLSGGSLQQQTVRAGDAIEELFVAVSAFEVKNELDDAVAAAFRARPHLVDTADGFLGMEVLRAADNPRLFWLITRWRDEASFGSWHRSHAYHASHEGIPKGLKLVPGSAMLRTFRRVCE